MSKIMFYPNENCVHLNGTECNALNPMVCRKRFKCSFAQTEKQANQSQERYKELMRNKPLEVQEFQAEKYHEGKMEW